jgi:uncharacterized protein YjbI with pentapeptide repeats
VVAALFGYALRKTILDSARAPRTHDADLRGAYFTGADLRGAYFTGADLRGAYLTGADLRGAGRNF